MMSSAFAGGPVAPDRKVVIDAGAAIRLQRLERFGGELFTTSGVLAEIRDENARALLKTLPQEIRIREPLPQDLAYAKQFAKATGDLGFLSQNDLSLIALSVTLNREAGGTVRDRPAAMATGDGQSTRFEWAPARASPAAPASRCSSFLGPESQAPDSAIASTSPQESEAAETSPEPASSSQSPQVSEIVAEPSSSSSQGPKVAQEPIPEEAEPPVLAEDTAGLCTVPGSAAGPQQEQEEEEQEGDSEDGSSAGEWVTPENITRFGRGVQKEGPETCSPVVCATADYSVQNVLLQMGITPLTFDGYAVRTVKLWGLICRACFFFTRDTQKVFCPKCGHDTVVRVPIVVDQDGQVTLMNHGRKLRTKGTVFSIPKPQMGRGWKPVFAEDELLMGGRDRELRHQQKLADKEKMARDPFNEDNGARGWWQRNNALTAAGGAPRVQAGYGRKNPNANNFKFKAAGGRR